MNKLITSSTDEKTDEIDEILQELEVFIPQGDSAKINILVYNILYRLIFSILKKF